MNKSKFDILYEQIMNSLNIPVNSNILDQQYYNDCLLKKHEQPIKVENYWIQIFTDVEMNSKDQYFSYILDDYGVVQKYLSKMFLNRDDCFQYAKNYIEKFNNNGIKNQYTRLKKTETRLEYKQQQNTYMWSDLAAETDFSLNTNIVDLFIKKLNENQLVQEYQNLTNQLLNKEIELIDEYENYILINIANFKTNESLFKIIIPYTSLNWFNQIFREILQQVRKNEQ